MKKKIAAKNPAKSKTILLAILQGLVGLSAITGVIGPVLGEKIAGYALLVAAVAHIVIRTITNQPIAWGELFGAPKGGA